MSISSRITQIEQHLTDDYSVLELAGADLTNVDKNIENLKQSWEERLLYFLANGTDVVWNNWLPKVTGSGTEITLNNTIEAKMDFVYKGNTYQYSTSGKNLFDNVYGQTGNVYTKHIGASSPLGSVDCYPINLLPNTQYTLKIDMNGYKKTSTWIAGVCFENGDVISLLQFKTMADITTTTFTTDSTGVVYVGQRYGFTYGETGRMDLFLQTAKIQLEKGSTATDYEPYTNGASPNPDYPQDIQVVSGDNTIKVEGKNLFDGEFRQGSWNSTTDTKRVFNKNNLFITKGTKCTFETSLDLTTYKYGIFVNDSAFPVSTLNTSIDSGWLSTNTYTFTATRDGYVGINIARINNANFGVNDVVNYDYQLYNKSQSYNITLGNLELCKIGYYQDRIYKNNGKWYLNKQIGKVVLDGSEAWDYYTSTSKPVFFIVTDNFGIYYKLEANLSCYCDYYKGKGQVASFDDVYNLGNNVITFRTAYTRLVIRDDRFNNTEDFKAELSTHNTIVYYVLATPTYEEITDTTLISQLEAIKKSYNTQTNISQENNDLPFELDVVALGE